MNELKKNPKIIGIGQLCPGSRRIVNASKKLFAEGGKRLQDFPKLQNILFI